MIKLCPRKISVGAIACFAIALLAVTVFPPGLCNAKPVVSNSGYALLIEQTPVDAGFVTPEPGVHEHSKDDILELRAIPKPGFKFLYWLGDVLDTTESETSVSLDSPKIVVAVFARTSNFDGGGGGGAGVKTPVYYHNPTPTISTIKSKKKPDPVPEPITLLTLGLGSLLAMRTRKK